MRLSGGRHANERSFSVKWAARCPNGFERRRCWLHFGRPLRANASSCAQRGRVTQHYFKHLGPHSQRQRATSLAAPSPTESSYFNFGSEFAEFAESENESDSDSADFERCLQLERRRRQQQQLYNNSNIDNSNNDCHCNH